MDSATQRVMFSSESTEYGTPRLVYDPTIRHFDLNFDAAASQENHLLPEYATQEGTYVQHFSTPNRRSTADGLTGSWAGRRVWCNPPYGRKTKDSPGIEGWVRKAALSMPECSVSVLLLPVRTETDWFQRWVFPYAVCYWVTGRLRFLGHDKHCLEGNCPTDGGGAHPLASAPFPSVLAVYRQGQRIPNGVTLGKTLDLLSDPEFHELAL